MYTVNVVEPTATAISNQLNIKRMIYTVTESTTNRAFKFVIHNNGKSKIRRFDQYYNFDYTCNMYGN